MLAAQRAGVRTFILPRKNARDLDEVPRRVLRDMKIVQADTMEDVLAVALVRRPEPVAAVAATPAPRRARKKAPARQKK